MARRGRGRGRGRGRPRKKAVAIESDEEEQIIETSETVDNLVEIPDEPPEEIVIPQEIKSYSSFESKSSKSKKSKLIDQEPILSTTHCDYNIDDISQLVAPTFSTISTGPPQPMLDLTWDHEYVPSAERIPSPNVHFCELCKLPIRLYGRMIPCKHVFCYDCAIDQTYDRCPRCSDRVHRVEMNQLGSVFMCAHEGTRYGYDGCRRTYLSQRDLQAHINHRHKPRYSGSSLSSSVITSNSSKSNVEVSPRGLIYTRSPFGHTSRSNLISVPIQGNSRLLADSSSNYGTSPETPSSTSSRYDRRGQRPSQNQESNSRSKWTYRF